ncbi:MAG: PfkB domain protein, partial [Conexibacter sp.]|nr:PfkB domain protein [Conexibacter sp.]
MRLRCPAPATVAPARSGSLRRVEEPEPASDAAPAPAIVIGEALVDLVCEQPVDSPVQARTFTAHVGGAPANVAVAAARAGAAVALAGGVGDDAWGAWLSERLAADGVDLRWFGHASGVRTPLAFVRVDAAAEPQFEFVGDRLAPGVPALADTIAAAVAPAPAVTLTTNTLLAEDERAVSHAARDAALHHGVPLLFDPNLRLDRWAAVADAVAAAWACIAGAFLVKANRAETELLTGEAEPAAGAAALRAAGARNVVVTLGADGALLLGDGDADCDRDAGDAVLRVPGVRGRATRRAPATPSSERCSPPSCSTARAATCSPAR